MLRDLLASNEVVDARKFLPPHAMELLAKAAV
jgi:hypothetical protein